MIVTAGARPGQTTRARIIRFAAISAFVGDEVWTRSGLVSMPVLFVPIELLLHLSGLI